MIPITNLRAGTTFLEQGDPLLVIKYIHTKMGRGSGNVKLKCRNLKTGTTIEKTFITGARVVPVDTQTRQLTFLYQEDKQLVFMDPHTFEQFNIHQQTVGEGIKFLKEGTLIQVLFWRQADSWQPLTVQLPPKLTFVVTQTAPGVKGNSASNVYKDAVLENSLKIRVPLFIKPGDRVRVDTRTGEYLERTK